MPVENARVTADNEILHAVRIEKGAYLLSGEWLALSDEYRILTGECDGLTAE